MISSINKWDGSLFIRREKAFLCADAISDLRSTQNTLSVWKADTPKEIEDAIVALALNREKVQKLCYFILDEEELAKINIDISDKNIGAADGLDKNILKNHRDLVELDYWNIGFLAEYMSKLAKEAKSYGILTASQVRNLLNNYKDNNKISLDLMKENLKKDLKW